MGRSAMILVRSTGIHSVLGDSLLRIRRRTLIALRRLRVVRLSLRIRQMAFLTLPSLPMGLVRYFAGREGYLQMVAGAWVDGFRLMVALWVSRRFKTSISLAGRATVIRSFWISESRPEVRIILLIMRARSLWGLPNLIGTYLTTGVSLGFLRRWWISQGRGVPKDTR